MLHHQVFMGISDEKNVHENSLKNPLTDYSKYKLLCEEILLNEINDHFEGIIIRPATVCGYSRRLRLDLVVIFLPLMPILIGK